jgi:uncharacterized protein (DUF362 family)
LTSNALAASAIETPCSSRRTAASLNSFVNNLRETPMTQFSFGWILSLNWLSQFWGPLHCYSDKLDEIVYKGLRLVDLSLGEKTILLKPNLVKYIPGVEGNTNPWLVGAAPEALRHLRAGKVIVGEGPGHQRDTNLVGAESSLERQLRERRLAFVDFNRDDFVQVGTGSAYTSLGDFWLPQSVVYADIVVSMPKIKTHHWAGVTLSMKNMFHVIPGAVYGWPKNVLNWLGIARSILDICSALRPHLVIADGILQKIGREIYRRLLEVETR